MQGKYYRSPEYKKELSERLHKHQKIALEGEKKEKKSLLKFPSPKDLQIRIESYFEIQKRNEKPFTISGLALYLDITTKCLRDYQSRDQYGDIVRRAKQRCEEYAETQLFVAKNPVGPIFNLKNNYGWRDKSEVSHSGVTMNKIVIERPHISLKDQVAKTHIITIPADIRTDDLEEKSVAAES